MPTREQIEKLARLRERIGLDEGVKDLCDILLEPYTSLIASLQPVPEPHPEDVLFEQETSDAGEGSG